MKAQRNPIKWKKVFHLLLKGKVLYGRIYFEYVFNRSLNMNAALSFKKSRQLKPLFLPLKTLNRGISISVLESHY